MRLRATLTLALTLALTLGSSSLRAQQLDTARVLGGLRDLAAACAADGARLWGQPMCGPLMLIDRGSRLAIATDTMPGRAVVPYAGAYVGVAPDEAPYANTAFDWSGRRWATVMLPLPRDRFDRVRLLAHESFHRAQPALGLAGRDPANGHLDEGEGRRLLRLELRAMAAALTTADDAAARRHAADAAIFRARREQRYPGADTLEAALEMQEGLAEYTGVRLAMTLTGEGSEAAARRMADFERTPSYVRAFAYGTGPGLGLLLDRWMPAWRDSVRQVRRPALLLRRALGVSLPKPSQLAREVERRALAYGGRELAAAEAARDSARRARLADYRARLVTGPVLVLRQQGLARAFNPDELEAFDASSTVYPTGTFGAEWGELRVTAGGALVANDFTTVRVPAPPSASGRTIAGAGWTLTLGTGWAVRPSAARAGDYEVVRAP